MNGHKIINQNSLHYLTLTIVGWIDVFSREIYKKEIIKSLQYCQQNKGLIIYAYVIMSNHLHMIIKAEEPNKLSDVLRDFKKFTSNTIIAFIENNKLESRKEWMLKLFKYYAKFNKNNSIYQLWIQDNKPIELTSPQWIKQKLDYIHLNPVRAGIVLQSEDYIYSSATNYLEKESILAVELLDIGPFEGYIGA
jgi:putative transposase